MFTTVCHWSLSWARHHPVHTFPPYSPKINSNIIFLSMPGSSEWSIHFRFSNQNFVLIFHPSHTCYIPKSTSYKAPH